MLARVLLLAETVFINTTNRCFLGGRSLALGCAISVLDMAQGHYPYARPERQMWNVDMAQMVRRYQAAFSGHSTPSGPARKLLAIIERAKARLCSRGVHAAMWPRTPLFRHDGATVYT